MRKSIFESIGGREKVRGVNRFYSYFLGVVRINTSLKMVFLGGDDKKLLCLGKDVSGKLKYV